MKAYRNAYGERLIERHARQLEKTLAKKITIQLKILGW
tara:strand:+ start:335 stop:448 length:114 start_codon:yes stop_codon:yes gene_type:complete